MFREPRASNSDVELNIRLEHCVSRLFTTLTGFGLELDRHAAASYMFTTPHWDLGRENKMEGVIQA